jgi:hypothetical protein
VSDPGGSEFDDADRYFEHAAGMCGDETLVLLLHGLRTHAAAQAGRRDADVLWKVVESLWPLTTDSEPWVVAAAHAVRALLHHDIGRAEKDGGRVTGEDGMSNQPPELQLLTSKREGVRLLHADDLFPPELRLYLTDDEVEAVRAVALSGENVVLSPLHALEFVADWRNLRAAHTDDGSAAGSVSGRTE